MANKVEGIPWRTHWHVVVASLRQLQGGLNTPTPALSRGSRLPRRPSASASGRSARCAPRWRSGPPRCGAVGAVTTTVGSRARARRRRRACRGLRGALGQGGQQTCSCWHPPARAPPVVAEPSGPGRPFSWHPPPRLKLEASHPQQQGSNLSAASAG
jgi:hypothetical protein